MESDGIVWERGRIGRMHSRRGRTVLIVVVLAAVVAVLLAIVLTRSPAARHLAAASPTVPATAPATGSAPVAGSSTPPSAGPTSAPIPAMLTAAPRGVTWELFRGVALPVSKADGPTKVVGPVHAGYSHTPTGALLAIAQISERYVITPGQGWRAVVAQQVEPGPGRDAYVKARAQVTDDTPAQGFVQIAGFQYVSYDGLTAVVNLATADNSTFNSSPVTVQWSNGDWRLVIPTVIVPATTLDTLAGYVPWQGVS